MKFRTRGLEHAELMEKVFGGSTATGEYHWTPSARTPPVEECQASAMQEEPEFVGSGEPPPVAAPESQPAVGTGSGSGGVRRRRDHQDDTDDSYSGSRRRQSHAARMSQSIADMADAVRARTNEVRLVWAERPNSMQDCVAKLLAMDSVDSASDLYLFAIDLFTTEVNREAFMVQPDDDHRLRWLEYQQRKHGQVPRPTYGVPPNPYYRPPHSDDVSRSFFPPN